MMFQEFSNQERCRSAKSALEGSLKEAGTKLGSGLEDLKTIGRPTPRRSSLPLPWAPEAAAFAGIMFCVQRMSRRSGSGSPGRTVVRRQGHAPT